MFLPRNTFDELIKIYGSVLDNATGSVCNNISCRQELPMEKSR